MLNIVVAFDAEAQPLVRGLALVRQINQGGYPVYSNNEYRLIVCGIGVSNCYNACQYLQEKVGGADRWLNFGVAGSAGYAVGDFVCAREVIHDATAEQWFLYGAMKSVENKATLYSVDKPQSQYVGSRVYEMEASGMMRYLGEQDLLDQANCLKLISDGPENIETLSISIIKTLIRDSTKKLIEIVQRISG